MKTEPLPNADISDIVAAAQQVGVELNARETRQWLIAMSQADHANTVGQDASTDRRGGLRVHGSSMSSLV